MNIFEEFRKLTRTYEDEDDYSDEYEDDAPPDVSDGNSGAGRGGASRGDERERRQSSQLMVTLVKPERFENATEIADHLKNQRTVILNLESAKKEVANRLLDFLSGVTYASDGNIERIAANTYLITPHNVEIEGDVIDELGSRNYF